MSFWQGLRTNNEAWMRTWDSIKCQYKAFGAKKIVTARGCLIIWKNVCIIFTGLVLVIVNYSFPNKPLKRGQDIGKHIVICFYILNIGFEI